MAERGRRLKHWGWGFEDQQRPWAEVEADHRALLVFEPRLHASDDARAAAERDHGGAPVGRSLEDLGHTRLVPWVGDEVRRARKLAPVSAHDVAIRLAQRMHGAGMKRVGELDAAAGR